LGVDAGQDLPRHQLTTFVARPYQPIAVAIVVNKGVWKSLSSNVQAELAEAARAVASQTEPIVERQERQAFSYLQSRGANVVSLTPEGLNRAQQASLGAWIEVAQGPQRELFARALAASRRPSFQPINTQTGVQTILFGTDRASEVRDRPDRAFGGKGTTGLSFGRVRVGLRATRSIDDKLEKAAALEAISHFGSVEEFKTAIAQTPGDLAIFVHGYYNTFADAVRRAALAKADFGFSGNVVVFSWPSDGEIQAYFSDEASIGVASINFRSFVDVICQVATPSRITFVAHSMGSRILIDYMDWAHGRPEFAGRAKFKDIVFAASDVPMLHFQHVKDKLTDAASRVSVYVSSNDRALYTSETLHSDIRIGRAAGEAMFISSDIDSIDASDIDNAGLFSTRHSYVFDKANGIRDLASLLRGELATSRNGLERKLRGPRDVYYRIKP
jgi:esterase/lipase superfamily enzyme